VNTAYHHAVLTYHLGNRDYISFFAFQEALFKAVYHLKKGGKHTMLSPFPHRWYVSR